MKPWHSILAAVFLLPVLYVLSLGPVARYLFFSEHAPSKAIRAFYVPTEWAWNHSPKFKNVYGWYVSLWIPEVYAPQRKIIERHNYGM